MDNKINVYWAPFSTWMNESWNMLYYQPERILDSMKDSIRPGLRNDSYMICPGVTGKFKNTYVLLNTLGSKFNFDEDGEVTPLNKDSSYVNMKSIRQSTIKNTAMLMYSMQWIFFAEESLVADFTPPYFHKPK